MIIHYAQTGGGGAREAARAGPAQGRGEGVDDGHQEVREGDPAHRGRPQDRPGT